MLVRARAPLRLGLAGGGTDVSPFCDRYGGAVLNATIGLYAYAVVGEARRDEVVFEANDLGQVETHKLDTVMGAEGALPLHLGVYRRVVRDFLKGRPLPINVKTWADVPPGSGLGSSSTLVVAMLKAMTELLQLPLGEYEIARLAFEIERVDLGMQGGRQDQYAATFGGFNYIEFEPDGHVIVNPLRVKNWILSELESSLVLYDTGVSRISSEIIRRQSSRMNDGPASNIPSLQAMKQDAHQMKAALLKGDIKGLAGILNRGWASKVNAADGITNSRIDAILQSAFAAGAIAGKVSGAGGGGFMMFIVEPSQRQVLRDALTPHAGRHVFFNFCEHGTQGWRIE